MAYDNWNDTATIKGTADAYSQIKIYDGTVSLGTVTASCEGYLELHHDPTVRHGTHLQGSGARQHRPRGRDEFGRSDLCRSDTKMLTGTGGDDFLVSSIRPLMTHSCLPLISATPLLRDSP